MAGEKMTRTEDDLRAAFMLAAQDAPSVEDVLARLEASETHSSPASSPPPSTVRAWWARRAPLAIAAVVLIAIGVPFAVWRIPDTGNSSSTAGGARDQKAASAPEADNATSGAQSSAAAGSGQANFGASTSAPPPPTVPQGSGPLCLPSQVTLTLTWQSDGSRLTGSLKATNHSSTACDLAVKPAVYPLDASGKRLAVQNVASAEGYAGPSRLLAGASATSTLTWFAWCGEKAGTRAEVDWGTGVTTVTVAGPTTPACAGLATPSNISSSWFGPLQ